MNSQNEKDIKAINKIINKDPIDEKALIHIIAKRTHKERIQIRKAYRNFYNRDLMKDFIQSKLDYNLKYTVLALFTDPVEFDVDSIYNSLNSNNIDNDTLIEIFASRPWWYLRKIEEIYEKKYKKDLEKELTGDSSDDFKNLLVLLLQIERNSNEKPDKNICQNIAKQIQKLKENELNINSPIIKKIFCESSPPELLIISREYHKLSGYLLSDIIEKEFKGDIKKLLKTVLYVLISPSEYFATRIYDAIANKNINEKALTRILVSRSWIDLPKIKEYYILLYKKEMIDDIKTKTIGGYQSLCIDLCLNS